MEVDCIFIALRYCRSSFQPEDTTTQTLPILILIISDQTLPILILIISDHFYTAVRFQCQCSIVSCGCSLVDYYAIDLDIASTLSTVYQTERDSSFVRSSTLSHSINIVVRLSVEFQRAWACSLCRCFYCPFIILGLELQVANAYCAIIIREICCVLCSCLAWDLEICTHL